MYNIFNKKKTDFSSVDYQTLKGTVVNLTLNVINGNLKLRLYSPFNSLNSYLVCLRFAPDGWWTIGTFLDYKSIRKMLRLIGRIFNPYGYLLYLVQGVPRNMTVDEWF